MQKIDNLKPLLFAYMGKITYLPFFCSDFIFLDALEREKKKMLADKFVELKISMTKKAGLKR